MIQQPVQGIVRFYGSQRADRGGAAILDKASLVLKREARILGGNQFGVAG